LSRVICLSQNQCLYRQVYTKQNTSRQLSIYTSFEIIPDKGNRPNFKTASD